MGRYGGDYGRGYGWEPARGRGSRWEYGPPYRGGYDAGWKGGRAMREMAFYGRGAAYGEPSYGRDYGWPRRGRRGGGMPRGPIDSGDVDTIRAAEIMTPNPDALTPETSIAEVARHMRDLDVGVIPIVDDDDSGRLQGVVTDRDIAVRVAAEGKDAKKTLARDIMSTDIQCVSENDHVRDVFAVMKRARVRRVPVTDAGGKLVGIIAQADLAVNYAGLDLQRETEVEEVIERISEPARPRWGREGPTDSRRRLGLSRLRSGIEEEIPDRLREGWRTLRREARNIIGRGYDRGWR
jgi:CBS domain-containing protein